MSMGCTRSWWLAAIDDRVQGGRGRGLLHPLHRVDRPRQPRRHGIYYFVPRRADALRHRGDLRPGRAAADADALRRPGRRGADGWDRGAGRKLAEVYRLYGKPDHFRSVVYANTGHEYLPEMKAEMVAWFEKYLPVQAPGANGH